MPRNDGYRRYFEAAAVLGEITRARAEELVREFMSSGDVQRAQAQQWVDELVERSRKAAEDLLDLVRTEVSNQMQALGLDPDDLARQAADILRRSAEAGRRVVRDVSPVVGGPRKPSGKAAGGKEAAAKKAPAKASGAKVTAKKAGAKKAGAKKSAAKKAGAKKSAAKKAPASSAAGGKKGAAKKSSPARTPAPASTR